MLQDRALPAILIASLAACASAKPTAATLAPDPQGEGDERPVLFLMKWAIRGHVISGVSATSDADAQAKHGQLVDLSSGGYSAPWATCAKATIKVEDGLVPFATFADEHKLTPIDATVTEQFGLAGDLELATLTCADAGPTDVLSVARLAGGGTAITCWDGACYLLREVR